MSYARFDRDSDVYVYESTECGFVCMSCSRNWRCQSWTCDTARQMIRHLKKHRKAGDKVPDYTLEELRMRIKDPDNDDIG